MNAPWWLAKVSAAWKRKHGPPAGCTCNATSKAMRLVIAKWVVAGIGKD